MKIPVESGLARAWQVNDLVLVPVKGRKEVGIIKSIGLIEERQHKKEDGLMGTPTGPYVERPIYEVYLSPFKTYFYLEKSLTPVKVDPDVARLLIKNFGGTLEE